MKFKGTHISEASGSLAGVTYSHNRGGQYMRARAVPVNPNTLQQQAVRTYMASRSAAWGSVLTQGQRDGWEAYADQVLLTDALGEPRKATGLNHYVRCNVPRMQAAMAGSPLQTAPATFDLGSYTNPVLGVIDASDATASIAFTNTDPWAIAVGGAMLMHISAGQSPATAYFKGPYRYAGKVLGAVVPPTSPYACPLPFAVQAGQRVFVKLSFIQVDGRLSSPFRTGGLVQA
jgi:hypothetical protein